MKFTTLCNRDDVRARECVADESTRLPCAAGGEGSRSAEPCRASVPRAGPELAAVDLLRPVQRPRHQPLRPALALQLRHLGARLLLVQDEKVI